MVFLPYNLILSRAGLIVISLVILVLVSGIIFWKFTANSKYSNNVTTQNSPSTEKNKIDTKYSESGSPIENKPAISTQELKRYTRLAEEGNIDAQRILGEIYFYGKGVKPNYQKSIQYFQLGAQQGDASSLYHLGRCFELGLGGLPHDTSHAISIYKQAKGFPLADKALKRLKAEDTKNK
jgi:TPR repeat protein